MSHKPPIPHDSQSPYPIQEPPHHHPHENETVAVARQIVEAGKRRALSRQQLGIGAAIGVGSAAIVAGLLYWRGNRR